VQTRNTKANPKIASLQSRSCGSTCSVTIMNILPTFYNGKKYRSSTEARWHAYFDLIGFQVVHEHDAYCINGVNYLPDFMAEKPMGYNYHKGHEDRNTPWFVEVKGSMNDALDVRDFMEEFSRTTQSLVSLVWGMPSDYSFPTWLRGEEVCPASYCHYGFTYKGWSEPFWTHEADVTTSETQDCIDRIRCGYRTRRGEFIPA
jgi:hypothetical protein